MVDVFVEIRDRLVFMLQVEEGSVSKCSRLSADLGCDHIDLNEFAAECEEEFGVEISDEALGKFVTVGDAVSFIEASILAAAPPSLADAHQ